jgi:hypothetical protein
VLRALSAGLRIDMGWTSHFDADTNRTD